MNRKTARNARTAILGILLVALTVAALGTIVGNGFVEFDDGAYILRNPVVRGGITVAGMLAAFTDLRSGNWHPLTWISHQLDAELFGMRPAGHHLVGLVLHLTSALLLFILIAGIGGRTVPAFIAAALFAVHPLHVESVAWAAERKDVLSGLFFMLTLLAWTKYVRGVYCPLLPLEGGGRVGVGPEDLGFVIHPPPTPPLEGGEQETRGHDPNSGLSEMGIVSVENRGHDLNASPSEMGIVSRKTRGHDPNSGLSEMGIVSPRTRLNSWYFVALVLFALGLMSKSMLVTVPLVLLILDWWPLGRLRSLPGAEEGGRTVSWSRVGPLLAEKTPFFLLALGAGLAALYAQKEVGALSTLGAIPAGTRLANAALSTAAYLRQTVWPAGLSFYYPFPRTFWPWWWVAGAAAILVALTALVFLARRLRPWLPAGWCWFVVMLLPVLGLVQVGLQTRADRYTYLPLVGVFLAVAWSVPRGTGRRSNRRRAVVLAVFLATLPVLAFVSFRQASTWRDDERLFTHGMEVTRDNWLAHHNLGSLANRRRDFPKAVNHLLEAVRLRPDDPEIHFTLGITLNELGQVQGAVDQFRLASTMNPAYTDALNNLGIALQRLGRRGEAAEAYERALAVDPAFRKALFNLALLRVEEGNRGAALETQRRLAALEPGMARELLAIIKAAGGPVDLGAVHGWEH